MHLLNKIEQWTQGGPTAGNLYQDGWENWDISALIGASGPGGLMMETGFFGDYGEGGENWGDPSVEGTTAANWMAAYGEYLNPYDTTQEQMIGKGFIDDMNQKFSETYQKFGIASKVAGKSGFGTSYSATSLTQDVIQNAGAAMGAARTKKDSLIYGAREDWVSELYNTFEYLGTMGAFDEDRDWND